MHKTAISAALILSILGAMPGRPAMATDPQSAARRKMEIERLKAEHARRVAEHNARSPGAHRGAPPARSKDAPPPRDFRGNPTGTSTTAAEKRDFRGNSSRAPGARQPAVPFNAASAPPPADALKAFVAAGKNATTMEALLNYLPASEAQVLKERQSSYDPRESAASRQQLKKHNPSLSDESLTFLTSSPYQHELDRLKRITGNILDVMSVKVEDNKATLKVSTNNGGTINGAQFEYGTAEIEFVGEGNAWKFYKYNDSGWVYQEQPR